MKLNIQLFASGKIYYDKSSSSSWQWMQFNVDWESTANYDTNKSTIITKAYVRAGTGGTQGTWKGTVKVGSISHSISINKSVSSSWVLLATFTDTVDHNNDGTLTLPIYGILNSPSGTTLAGQTSGGTQNAILDTIPRASTITVPDGTIGYGVTISINKTSNSFSSKLYYKMSGQSDYTYITDTNEKTYSWVIPTSFYSLIPNARSITGVVKADTYNGNTLIGSKESNLFTAYINETDCKPEITNTSINDTINLSSLTDRLVKYVSKPKITFTINAKNGASITYKNPSTSPFTYSSWQDSYTINTQDSRQIPNSYTFPINTVNYIPLTINANANRQDGTSDKVDLTINGNWFNGNFDKKTNTLQLKVQYKLNGTDSWNEEVLTPNISGNTFSINKTLDGSFDYQQIYNIQIVATDEIGKLLGSKIEKLKDISRGQPNWEAWHDDSGEHTEFYGDVAIKGNGYNTYIQNNANSGDVNFITNKNTFAFNKHIYAEDGASFNNNVTLYQGYLNVANGNISLSGNLSMKGTTYLGLCEENYLGNNYDIDTLKGTSGIYGVYNCSKAPNLNLGALEVVRYSNDWIIQRFNDTTTGYTWERRFYMATTWSPWEDKKYYHSGDTLALTNDETMNGMITASTTRVYVTINLPKNIAIDVSSISVEGLYVEARGIKGYLNSQSGYVQYIGKSGYSLSAYMPKPNSVVIVINKSSAFTNATNNTPISLNGRVSLRFN